MYGTRDAASNWKHVWQEHLKSSGYQSGLSSKNVFRREKHRVPGMTHGDDFLVTDATDRLADLKNKIEGVDPVKTQVTSYGLAESIKALNRRLHRGKRGVVSGHDSRHDDVLAKDFRLEHGNSVQTPGPNAIQQILIASCKMCVL